MGDPVRLDGKVALVTGAGRGLGRAHAIELAARGAHVVVNDVGCGLFGEGSDPSVAGAVVDEIAAAGGTAVANTLSVDRPDSARQIVQAAVDAFDRLDIVVNNAGFLRRRPFLDHTPEMVADLLAVHVTGSYFISQAAFAVMLEQEFGRFIFTSSPGGTRGNPLVTAYGAAKAGIIGLAQAVALAGAPHNIRANVISPYAATRMADAMETKGADERLHDHSELLAKVLDPRHASAVVAYLASDECELNHSILTVGGGRVALTAFVIGEGWQAPFGELLTAESVRDHLPSITDLSAATNPQSSDQEGSAFLRAAVQAHESVTNKEAFMKTARYRVVQWATGDTGRRGLREVIRHPDLDLVGVKVYDAAKAGVDAGELCGEGPTGVTATTDREEILGLKADCVIYVPRAVGRGKTRAGLTEEELLDDVCTLLEAGMNVITTCTDLHAGGRKLAEGDRARIQAAGERGGASLYATGSDPGFITEVVPYALLSAQRRVDLVEIIEWGDLSHRPSPHMVMEQMRFGRSLADFDPDRRSNHLRGEVKATLGLLADAAGLAIDEWTAAGSVAAAKHDTKIVAGEIKAGTAAGQRAVITGRSGGKDVVRYIQYAYCTPDLDVPQANPPWEVAPTGWRVRVEGDAPFDCTLAFPIPMDDISPYVPGYNINRGVNAIPYVCAAPAGFVSDLDLPAVVPGGPRVRTIG